MTTTCLVALLLVALFATSVAASSNANPHDTRKPYIVHMIKSMKPHPFTLHEHWYASLLRGVSGSQTGPSQLLYTYDTVLHGFAAKLSSTEARALERMDGTLAVIPSSAVQIHTTRSSEFLGLTTSTNGLWSRSNYGKDVIVGVLDTGIWPERRSFQNGDLGPVPSKWKGECQSGVKFSSSHCNTKIIGARYFIKGFEASYGPLNESLEYRSPRDAQGHGTHTASTVAGFHVHGASVAGFANGTAVGMAPQARLAIYKVLWEGRGDSSDIAAAIDTAVADGVDILSLSLGASESIYESIGSDAKAIAAFGAAEKGVFVSMSAGNDGPFPQTLSNTAPWVTTVGASTMDREFPAPVILGNLKRYKGSSFYKGDGLKSLSLVYVSHNQSSKRCHPGSLPHDLVKDKIVLCDQGFVSKNKSISDTSPWKKGSVVKEAGGAGMIVANEKVYGAETYLSTGLLGTDLPATIVSFWSGQKIKAYIGSTGTPTATINPTGSTVIGKEKAPMVAAFSSRGPSMLVRDIVKPDLIAPGVNILAAYSGGKEYSLLSGTSMSCPHVSGVAALIRAVHPSWSPGAVKSALMTSSHLHDNKKQLIQDEVTLKPADAFVMGAGHINPRAAVDPGLVYDMTPQDYIDFLCSLGATKTEIALITRSSVPCPNPKLSVLEAGDLNYPSFSVLFDSKKFVHVKRRTVTNVGAQSAVYKALVKSPLNVKISVEPNTLEFNGHNKKLSFTVRFESLVNATDHPVQEFGQIAWKCISGGNHVVRSPVAIQWPLKKN